MKSQISPQKRLLNFQELTPAKVQVGYEINGWLETHKKSPSPIKRPSRRYSHKYMINNPSRQPSKSINHQKHHQTPTNIQSLKKKIKCLNLLNDNDKNVNVNTNTNGKLLSNFTQSTASGSGLKLTPVGMTSVVGSNRTSGEGRNYWGDGEKKLNEKMTIEVSAFDIGTTTGNKNESKELNHKTTTIPTQSISIPSTTAVAISDRTAIRMREITSETMAVGNGEVGDSRFSLKKLQEKNKRMMKILSYNQMRNKNSKSTAASQQRDKNMKRPQPQLHKSESIPTHTPVLLKKNLISQSVNILKESLTPNQHKALNMIVRKTQNVAVVLPKNKKANFFTDKMVI